MEMDVLGSLWALALEQIILPVRTRQSTHTSVHPSAYVRLLIFKKYQHIHRMYTSYDVFLCVFSDSICPAIWLSNYWRIVQWFYILLLEPSHHKGDDGSRFSSQASGLL